MLMQALSVILVLAGTWFLEEGSGVTPTFLILCQERGCDPAVLYNCARSALHIVSRS